MRMTQNEARPQPLPATRNGLSTLGAVPVLAWLILAGQATGLAWGQWRAEQSPAVAPLVIFTGVYAILAYASWRSSRWPVLAAEFYFVANTVSLGAGWTPLAPHFIASTVLFGLVVAIGFEQWPSQHWQVLRRPPANPADARDLRAHARDLLADVPLSVLLAGLGLVGIAAVWSVTIIARFALSAEPRTVTFALLAVPALGLAGATIFTALARLSRAAALGTIAFPALYVVGNGGAALADFTAAAPASVLFALLLLPHWGRMTWRLSGYAQLPRATAQAFS